MKKAIGIILLISFTCSIVGYYPVFLTLQLQVRKEIKHRIKQGVPDEDIHKIAFHKNDKIKWVKAGKEFLLDDEMFDVVRKEIKNDSIFFDCINDVQERSLFASLDKLMSEEINNEKSSKGKTAQLLYKIFTQSCITETGKQSEIFRSNIIVYFQYSLISLNVILAHDFPPPDFA